MIMRVLTVMLMKVNILFSILVLSAQSMFANDDLLKNLMSGDRTVRKDAVQTIEQLSKKDLINLAQDAVQSEALRESDAVYAFHRILSVAQEQGFGVDDAVTLLEKHHSSKVGLALLDWLGEFGVETVDAGKATEVLAKIERYVSDKKNDLKYRIAAYNVCRELAWKVKHRLDQIDREKEKSREAQKQKLVGALRSHINRICQIAVDEDESDNAVELFAGYIPYYRAYVQDGICDDAMLKFSVQQALVEKKRGAKCKETLKRILSRHWKQ